MLSTPPSGLLCSFMFTIVFSCVFLTSGAWWLSEDMKNPGPGWEPPYGKSAVQLVSLESMSRIMSRWHLPQSEVMARRPTATSSISFSLSTKSPSWNHLVSASISSSALYQQSCSCERSEWMISLAPTLVARVVLELLRPYADYSHVCLLNGSEFCIKDGVISSSHPDVEIGSDSAQHPPTCSPK